MRNCLYYRVAQPGQGTRVSEGQETHAMGKTGLITLFTAMLACVTALSPVAQAEDDGDTPLKIIYVVTDEQKLYAWEGNQLVHEFDVVTGRPGKETEPGVFHVFRKHEDYTSKTYGSPMPYTMFFSQDGKAIHGTQWATLRSYLHVYITESVGSHGCVGLTSGDAKTMFEWAPVKTRIVVLEEEPDE
jgi:lipoprotein-anchoring transpeptidase ErfK/SrfK